MNVEAIDHVNLHIPEDGVDEAVAFYRDGLGLELENLDLFEAGEKPFFSVRLASTHVVHVQPDPSFESPAAANFDHLAVTVSGDIDSLRDELDAAGIEVDRELEHPVGATGTNPAVYVTDPFGYRLELKVA